MHVLHTQAKYTEAQRGFVGEIHNLFVNRVAPSWNILPTNVISS